MVKRTQKIVKKLCVWSLYVWERRRSQGGELFPISWDACHDLWRRVKIQWPEEDPTWIKRYCFCSRLHHGDAWMLFAVWIGGKICQAKASSFSETLLLFSLRSTSRYFIKTYEDETLMFIHKYNSFYSCFNYFERHWLKKLYCDRVVDKKKLRSFCMINLINI